MRRVLTLGLVAAALGDTPGFARAETVNYAIVIGNNSAPVTSSQERLGELRFADDDAVRYYNLFSQLGETRLLTVMDKRSQRRFPGVAKHSASPTLANLRRTALQFAESMREDLERGDTPVFYFAFSGHGALDEQGEAYLVLMDGKLTQEFLYENLLAEIPSTYSHLIVDACHAGGVVGARGGGFFDKEKSGDAVAVSKEDLVPVLESSRMQTLPNLGVLLSASLGEEAHEWSAIESGVFTHEVLSGLLGAADVNADRVIEYSEIRAFVASANRNVKDVRARPRIVASPPRANHSVALLDSAKLRNSRELHGDISKLGHFFIELPNGTRYLEAHLASGVQATLRIPAGDAYIRTAHKEAHIPAGASTSLSELSWTLRRSSSKGSLDEAYRKALFDSPYGRGYYQGWVDSSGAHAVRFESPGATAPWSTAQTKESGNRYTAIGFVGLAGASSIVALGAGYRAYRAKLDWEATDLQHASDLAKNRYNKYRAVGLSALVLSAVSGAASWYLWPTDIQAVPLKGGLSLSLRGSW